MGSTFRSYTIPSSTTATSLRHRYPQLNSSMTTTPPSPDLLCAKDDLDSHHRTLLRSENYSTRKKNTLLETSHVVS